ncbi:adenylate/guanylate cyclase domain-containing protein, partial [Limnoraphis robusta]
SLIFLTIERSYPTSWKKIPEEISFYLLLFNFHGFVIFVFFNVSHFVLQKDLVLDALDREHSKTMEARQLSDKLLLNILPLKIAERLKLKEEYIVDDFANVSVLFADIVGFTKISETLTPEKLVEILNRIFVEFDYITERNGLEKIKTIGDAYMAAAGIPEIHAEHAIACVKSALEMNKFIKNDPFLQNIQLELRIGIHSGAVVAGVIGKNKFAYDLWGDAVNTASRMESHGSPGEIQITKSVKDSIGDRFVLEERGLVNVKGKGMVETYFVKGYS